MIMTIILTKILTEHSRPQVGHLYVWSIDKDPGKRVGLLYRSRKSLTPTMVYLYRN